MFGLCKEEGIGIIPWSPLARGKLTRPWEDTPSTERGEKDEFGKVLYKRTEDSDKKIVEALAEVSKTKGIPMAQVAMAWQLSKPTVTSPIVGATKPHHLEDAVTALSVTLSKDEIESLERGYVPHPVGGFS